MLILSIESMCSKHQGSSKQSGSYATLSSFLRLNRTLCGIKQGSTPYLEKKKIIVQRRRGFSMIFLPLPLVRNKENGNIEVESWLVVHCSLWYQFILCRLYSEALSERNLKKNQKYPLLAKSFFLSYPTCYQCRILTMNPQNFQTLLSSDFNFSDQNL